MIYSGLSDKIKKDFHKFCNNHRSCKSCPYGRSDSCEIDYIADYVRKEFEELKATELRREYFKGFIAGYEKAYYER